MGARRVVRLAIASAALLLVPACGGGDDGSEPSDRTAPAVDGSPEDPRRARLSEAGLYRMSLRPEEGVPLGRMHRWILHLETGDGEPFLPNRIAFSGGMPQHGHGFETEPRVTRKLGGGDFLIEGVRFHMAGDWTLRVEVAGPPGVDVAVFHVRVGP